MRVHSFFLFVPHFRFVCLRRKASNRVKATLIPCGVSSFSREQEGRERKKSHSELNKDLRLPGKRRSATALERWNWTMLEKPSGATRARVRNTKEKGDWRLCPGALKFDGKGRLTRLTNWSAHDILWWREKARPPTRIKKHTRLWATPSVRLAPLAGFAKTKPKRATNRASQLYIHVPCHPIFVTRNPREKRERTCRKFKGLASWTSNPVSRFAGRGGKRKKKKKIGENEYEKKAFARREHELSRAIWRKRVFNERRKLPNGSKWWSLRRWNYINGPVRWSLWNGSLRFMARFMRDREAKKKKKKKKEKYHRACYYSFRAAPWGISEIYNPPTSRIVCKEERKGDKRSNENWPGIDRNRWHLTWHLA